MLMENLIKCSKVLYDNDISNKMKEITQLKIKIAELEKDITVNKPPKIFFNNHLEWHTKVSETLDYIYDNITNIQFVEAGTDAEIFTGSGLWMISDKQTKYELLKQCLIWIGGSEKWAEKIASNIIADIKSVLDTLKLHENYGEQEIRDFIFCFIQDKLCERHKKSILADIPQYKCPICGVIYNDPYDSEDDGDIFDISELCRDCYNNKHSMTNNEYNNEYNI